MKTETQLHGVLQTWIGTKGFGFILVQDQNSIQKYYLHISRIKSSVRPAVGMGVRFNVIPEREGRLPSAFDAELDPELENVTAPVNPSPIDGRGDTK